MPDEIKSISTGMHVRVQGSGYEIKEELDANKEKAESGLNREQLKWRNWSEENVDGLMDTEGIATHFRASNVCIACVTSELNI